MDERIGGDGTRCVHAGVPQPTAGAPLHPGPVFAAPYHLDGAGTATEEPDIYGRASNPTWRALEEALGELDGGHCVVFPSGMAALSTVLRTVVAPDAAIVLPEDGYYAVRDFVSGELAERPGPVRTVPTPGPWPEGVFDGAGLVLLESPSNPGLDVCDIAELARRAHAAGALVAVDNTTATPLGQRPLELGADLVLVSDTKAVAGHSDVLLGHVTAASAHGADRLRRARTLGGAIPGPFEAWLVHRGLATLDLRLSRQAANAAALVEVLSEHPAVHWVRWPGASFDPAYELARRQMRRFNGVVGFALGDAAAVSTLLRSSSLLVAATSFGGVHTTLDRRAQFGDPVPEGFVRLSAGCEDTADLVDDLRRALDVLRGR